MAHYAALRFRLIAVTVDYGQWHHREIDSARVVAAHFGADHRVVDLRTRRAAVRFRAHRRHRRGTERTQSDFFRRIHPEPIVNCPLSSAPQRRRTAFATPTPSAQHGADRHS
ncbi:7-cyano-7-deazaguanine synthase [Streptomyces iranensis]